MNDPIIWQHDKGHETVSIETYGNDYLIESITYSDGCIIDRVQIDVSKEVLIDMISKLSKHFE